MECKNCQTQLSETAKFCFNCGAKYIGYRLNFKTITEELFTTFISWDNKFFKTFSHLITKPQEVANSYLEGVRKRYMRPFSYMIIALTFYGIYMYFAKDILMELVSTLDANTPVNPNPKIQKFQDNFNDKWFTFITKYYNIFTFLSIPLLAFINKIIFKKRNLVEHSVTLLYAYATYLIMTSFLGFIFLIFQVDFQFYLSINYFLMIGYHMYFYKKTFQLSLGKTLLKTLLFWLLIFAFYLVIVILGIIAVFVLVKFKIITF